MKARLPFFGLSALIAIFATAHWRALTLWFNHEDLALLYLLGHPAEAREAFAAAGNQIYRNQLYLFPWQFHLFGYHPLGYILTSLAMFGLMLWVLYALLRALTGSRIISWIATALSAAGYIGIETLSWNPINGFQTYLVLVLGLGALLLLRVFFQTGNRFMLAAALLVYLLNAWLLQFRSYLLLVPTVLFILLFWPHRGRRVLWQPIALAAALIAINAVILWPQLRHSQGTISSGEALSLREAIVAAFGNIGSSTFGLDRLWNAYPGAMLPIMLVVSAMLAAFVWLAFPKRFGRTLIALTSIGLLMTAALYALRQSALFAMPTDEKLPWAYVALGAEFIGMVALLGATWLRGRHPMARPLWFFWLWVIGVGIGITVTARFVGSPIWIYPNTHRFLSFIAIGVVGIEGIILGTIFGNTAVARRTKVGLVALLGTFLLSTIAMSDQALLDWSRDHSQPLRFFYTELQKKVPTIPEKTVFQFSFSAPRAVNPFVTGQFVSPDGYLAGLYGRSVENLKISEGFDESTQMLKKNDVGLDHLFVFDYHKDQLTDLTEAVRSAWGGSSQAYAIVNTPIELGYELTGNGHRGKSIIWERSGLNIPTTAPLRLNLALGVNLAGNLAYPFSHADNSLSAESCAASAIESEFAAQITALQHNARFEGAGAPNQAPANVLDGNPDSVWIPANWGEAGFQVDFSKPIQLEAIVFAQRHWPGRTPSAYRIEGSTDKTSWTTLSEMKGGKALHRNEFSVRQFQPQAVRYVRLTVQKTVDGRLPALDTLIPVPAGATALGPVRLEQIMANPFRCVSDQGALKSIWDAYGVKVGVPIQWQTTQASQWSTERQVIAPIGISPKAQSFSATLPLPATEDGHAITAVRVGPLPGPLTARVEHLELTTIPFNEFKPENAQ